MLVAGVPGGCNLADHQVEHSQDVAGNLSVLDLAGSFQVVEYNQSPVGQLHMVGDIQVVHPVGNLPVDTTCQLLLLCSRPMFHVNPAFKKRLAPGQYVYTRLHLYVAATPT